MVQIKNKKLYKISYLLFVASLLVGVVPIQPVQAAFPGQNGKVVFDTNRDGNFEIYTMNVDGSNPVNLTNDSAPDVEAQWSPDGTKILFRSQRDSADDLYLMNADGSNVQRLTTTTGEDVHGSFSPDGTKIIFISQRDGVDFELYTMNADGTNQTRLTNNVVREARPSFSPDGTKVVFRYGAGSTKEIYVMNSDGTSPVNLTNNNPVIDDNPDWSPDGTKIVFYSTRAGANVHIMNADGTSPIQITTDPGIETAPSWSPDGTLLIFQSNAGGDYEIITSDVVGSNQVVLTSNTFTDSNPSFQPLTLSPIATNESTTTTFSTPIVINVLANDIDTYGFPDPTSVTVTVQPANGTTSVNTTTGTITYAPNTGFIGNDSFTYRVCSSESATLCDTAVLSITVTAAPVIPGLPYTGTGTASPLNWPVMLLLVVSGGGLSWLGVWQVKQRLSKQPVK